MADTLNEYWYLEPGTDANKITMPHLRRILLTHDIRHPSGAKKQVLVDLFNEHVAPQAAQIRRAQAQTKRSTRGIVDVPSSSASTVTTDDMEEATMLAPEPVSAPLTSRRTTRAQTEELEVYGKTPSRAVPAKHSRAEPEADERPAPRRTRKSATPAVKREPSEPEAWHRNDVGSPFTQENPFQSGSSPAVPETTSRDRRRRTLGNEQKEKRKSDTHRRRTAQPNVEQLDNVAVPSRGTFDVADPRFEQENNDVDDAGEEFTPEEQLELVRERAKAGEVDILPPRRRNKASKATGTLKAMSGTLLLVAATVFGGAWRQEKIALGFCGIGRDISTGLAGVEVPDWAAEYVVPTCEPCPPHAQCFKGLELRCETDFIRRDHPLALNGLIPIPPTCEPDSAKAKKINAVADRAVHILRQRKAQYECGEPDAEGHVLDSPEVSEDELKQQMAAQKIKGMTDQEFSELFDRAFPEMTNREEIIETTDG